GWGGWGGWGRGRRAWPAPSRHPAEMGRKVRAQDEFAVETARLDAAVGLSDLIEGDPPGDARPDCASCQLAQEPPEVLPEPGGMLRPQQVDRIDAGALAAKQPLQQRLEILARQPHQDGERSTLRMHGRRVAVGAEGAAALGRGERAAITALADAVEDDVKPAR